MSLLLCTHTQSTAVSRHTTKAIITSNKSTTRNGDILLSFLWSQFLLILAPDFIRLLSSPAERAKAPHSPSLLLSFARPTPACSAIHSNSKAMLYAWELHTLSIQFSGSYKGKVLHGEKEGRKEAPKLTKRTTHPIVENLSEGDQASDSDAFTLYPIHKKQTHYTAYMHNGRPSTAKRSVFPSSFLLSVPHCPISLPSWGRGSKTATACRQKQERLAFEEFPFFSQRQKTTTAAAAATTAQQQQSHSSASAFPPILPSSSSPRREHTRAQCVVCSNSRESGAAFRYFTFPPSSLLLRAASPAWNRTGQIPSAVNVRSFVLSDSGIMYFPLLPLLESAHFRQIALPPIKDVSEDRIPQSGTGRPRKNFFMSVHITKKNKGLSLCTCFDLPTRVCSLHHSPSLPIVW